MGFEGYPKFGGQPLRAILVITDWQTFSVKNQIIKVSLHLSNLMALSQNCHRQYKNKHDYIFKCYVHIYTYKINIYAMLCYFMQYYFSSDFLTT